MKFMRMMNSSSDEFAQLMPKLRDWWGSVKHTKALANKARVTCEIEGLEYVETSEIPSIRCICSNGH